MIDRDRIEAFVEKRVDYYAEKWMTIADGTGSRVQWNWAAAVGGVVWLLYRKLYLPVAIVVIVSIADINLIMALEDAEVWPVAVAFWDGISYWVYSAVFGAWGNYWYYQKFRKTNELVTGMSADSGDRLNQLAEKGGTSIFIAGLFLLTISSLVIWDYVNV